MSTSQKRRRSSQNVVDDADGSTGTSVEVAEPLSSCKSRSSSKGKKTTARKRSKKEGSGSGSVRTHSKDEGDDGEDRFLGEPIPESEARIRWPVRYETKRRFSKKGDRSINSKSDGDEEEILRARCHYSQAMVDGVIYNLNEDAYVKGEDGMPNYIGRIVEFFEAIDKKPYFTAQWFFKAEDTVIKTHANLIDGRRVFFSDLRDDNPLDCIISKIKIIKVAPNINLAEKEAMISECDFYYDMKYSLAYSTFVNLPKENVRDGSETSSTISAEGSSDGEQGKSQESSLIYGSQKSEMKLLDLYSGCGGMSTGLCLGARLSGVNLVTRWAVDLNPHACESLKLNHPETEVRNESADNFLNLLKEWEKLCREFSLLGTNPSEVQSSMQNDEEDDDDDATENSSEEFEVGKLIGVCYGDPNETKEPGLYFKVSWKGYGPEEDTWEPVDGLSNCREKIQDFVTNGYKSNMLPLPGDVDVVCGGPPCQGASGFNRFRNNVAPLDDEKNRQMIVYMDIVNYLKPMYVLMENVVDILKFSGGFLGRYALSRLVAMNYQARLGMMVAGCYGLPQFRMRVFLWGAHATKKLPQYPLPINEVVVRGVVPKEFEQNVVAYNEDQPLQLQKALHLGDAISDLPEITNYETRDEMPYGKAPRTEFQKQIRLSKHELLGFNGNEVVAPEKAMLHDHRPLKLNEDDYQRVCRIPKEKGANFRDLPGVLVRPDNKVEWDQSVERVLLPSGKPLVPDYAMTFVGGGSSKPFGRLWWDEIVPTVVTRAEPHNQVILHPLQDRVLSIRENARLQGFPDYYKLCGPVKERYIQIGNAVAVPVARALGYSMGLASRGECDDQPLLTLPPKFPNYLERLSTVNSMPSVEEN